MVTGVQGADSQAVAVPLNILKTWESMLNILSKIIGVPASLIMRAHADEFEILAVNDDNRWHNAGDRHSFGDRLFCEEVMTTKKELIVPDGRDDKQWADSPAVQHGLVSYMGFPLLWPNGQFFGTICVLDEKTNEFSETFKILMGHFKDAIELGLFSIYMNNCLRNEVVRRKQAEAKLKISLSTARQLNEKLLAAKNKAAAAAKTRDEFLTQLEEEAQNAMTSIDICSAALADSQNLSAEDVENLDIIRNSAARVKEIISELAGKSE